MRTTTRGFLSASLAIGFAGVTLAQDDCSTAVAASGLGSFPYDRTTATTSGFNGGDPVTCSIDQGGLPGDFDTFFQWTATGTGDRNFQACLEGADTVMYLHLGTGCAATCFLNGDGNLNCTGNIIESEISVPGVVTGDTYLVQIASWGTGAVGGAGALDVTVPPLAPPNDDCSGAVAISGLGTFAWDNSGATSTLFGAGSPPCVSGGGQVESDVFYQWTATSAGDRQFDTIGTAADTVLALHAGTGCSAICAFYDDDSAGNLESRIVVLGVASGDTYLVQVGGFGLAPISMGLLNVSVPLPPPANDTCATPTPVSGLGTFPWDNTTAFDSGFDGGDPVLCGQTQGLVAPHQDVFFQWTPAVAGDFTFDTCGSGVDTVLNLHAGVGCAATCFDANDQSVCGNESQVSVFGVMMTDTYLIQVGLWTPGGGTPAGILNVTVALPPPANNDCSTPTAITGYGTWTYDNTTATTSGFDGGGGACPAAGAGGVEGDVFFAWTATVAGDVQFDTIGSVAAGQADSLLSVHLGADCAAVCVAHADDGFIGTDAFTVVPGVAVGDQYLVQAGVWLPTQVGPGVVNISAATPPPANDDCSAPTVASLGLNPFDSTFATDSFFDGGDPVECGETSAPGTAPAQDLFWVFAAPCDGTFVANTCDAGLDSVINVHLGSDCSAVCLIGEDGDPTDVCLTGATVIESSVTWAATGGQDYLIQVGAWATGGAAGVGNLEIVHQDGPCGPAGGITIACSPPLPHYLGGLATCAASSLGAATPSGLHLECTDGPSGEFGFFLVAAGSSLSLNIFNGILCLDAPQGRYNPLVATNQGLPQLNAVGQFDAAGVLQSLFGTAPSTGGSGYDVPLELPFSPAGQSIQPGDTWHFQCWYRDQVGMPPVPGSSANFSDVAVVTFP